MLKKHLLPVPSLGARLSFARRVRGMKQTHVAEYFGVTQPIVSRIERGELVPTGTLRTRVLDFVAARLDPARDAGLRRLIERAGSPVHLICDITHLLLAASPARENEWQRSFNDFRGRSLWPFATDAICAAEARLPELGWGERDGTNMLTFATPANQSRELRIAAGVLIWDRIILADGSPARIVTRI
jgi:transcriptional regulator with XRE-family HTH domain